MKNHGSYKDLFVDFVDRDNLINLSIIIGIIACFAVAILAFTFTASCLSSHGCFLG